MTQKHPARTAYDRALEQVRRSPADLTDEQIETLRTRNPQFAKMAASARERHRNGAAFQRRLAADEYAKNVDRQRQFAALVNRPGVRSDHVNSSVRRTPTTSTRGVVRMDPRVRGR